MIPRCSMAVAQILQPDAKAGSQFANLTDISTTSSVPWILCTWGRVESRVELANEQWYVWQIEVSSELTELTNWSLLWLVWLLWGGYDSAAPEGHFTSPRWRERGIGWSQSRAHRRWPGKLAESTAGKFLVLATVGSSQLEMIWSCSQMDASTFCSIVPFGGWWFSWLTAWSRCDQGLILPHLHRLNRCSQHFHLIFSKITETFVEVVILLGRCFRWSSPWAEALPEGHVGVRAWGVQCLLILSNTNSFSWPQAAEARQIGHCWRKREACGGSWRSQLPLPSQPRWTRSKRSSQSQPETRFTTHLHFAYPTLDVPSSIWVCPNNRAYPDVAISTDQIMTIYIIYI